MTATDINSQLPGAGTAEEAGRSGSEASGAFVRRVHGSTGIVLFTDLEGNIAACDEAALAKFDRNPSEVFSRPLAVFLTGEGGTESKDLQQSMLASVLRLGQYRCSVPCQTRDDKRFSADLSLTLLRDGRSVPTGIVAVVSAADGTGANEKAEPAPGRRQASFSESEEDESPHTVRREIEGSAFVLTSPLMHRFVRMVDRVAGHTETVLITGETGTGKELIARSIHQSSNRRGRPWVDINCAALPENLVESELFGYEKGAFTGADVSKPGLFELADRGTLFLDEIGELQLHTQVKLLRVLDGYPFYRLGGHRKIKVDVRIVAATNQDLEAAVTAGRFRQDLFHRLGQFQLRVPPLRERPEDIVALAEHFLHLKAPRSSFVPDAVSALLSHAWPGNVRELRNLVARVAVQSNHPEIQPEQIGAAMSGSPTAQRQSASMPVGNLDSMEEQMIIRALERSGGHRGQAADQLGISRRTLSRKLKEYNIDISPGEGANALGFISLDQQKFFRARIQLAVTLKNQRSEEASVQGVNLSTGGMGLDGLKEPMRFSGLLDVSFPLPDTEIVFRAKARIVWMGDEGRVGLRFAVIDPILFEQLQHWTNKKMKDEGWDLPA
ncbi:MAG TPA: sigma 54-interacting transcriptional regulator [Candidatus Deferrimicrobiaceae bacterium]|nr:sigma 54-interacting transcriptional regulator [Candidatus Deferrimicrobiaceae bacterium]